MIYHEKRIAGPDIELVSIVANFFDGFCTFRGSGMALTQSFRDSTIRDKWCPVEKNRDALKALAGEPLLVFAGASVTLGAWREDAECWQSSDGWVLHGVTHFMILPADPVGRERPIPTDRPASTSIQSQAVGSAS